MSDSAPELTDGPGEGAGHTGEATRSAGVIDVVLAAGQSNMVGKGRFDELPDPLKQPHPTALLYTAPSPRQEGRDWPGDRHWQPLGPANGPERGFGPELSFGHTFAAASATRLAIFKFADGGTGLFNDWRPDDRDDPSTLTHACLRHAAEAIDALRRLGHTPRLRGLLWYQGERDTRPDNPEPQRHADRLRAWIDRVRGELGGGAGVPFVLFRVHPHHGNTPHADAIRHALVATADHDPAGAWVDVDNLHYPDQLHPDGPSLLTAGDRAAHALLALPISDSTPSLPSPWISEPAARQAATPAAAAGSAAERVTATTEPSAIAQPTPEATAPRRIALMNQKGGVGKTTTAVSVGAALARAGHRVLMVDLDPQAHLTLSLGFDPGSLDKSLYDLLTDDATTASEVVLIADQQPNLGLLPAETNLAGVERELADLMATGTAQTVLREKTSDLVAQFDYVLLDCPPALNLLTVNALTLAREVIVPMQAHYLAMQGLTKLLETIAMVRRGINRELKVSGVVLCMFEGNTLLAGEIVDELTGFFESARGSDQPWADAVVYHPPIRRNIKLAEAPSYGQSIHQYAPDSHGSADYQRLARAISGRA